MPVGERGSALSGGQRQAVALARTLARDAEVFVLDEPSSNLDMASENRLMRRLQGFLRGKTLVLMTHRPSLLALVDRVIVLNEQRVVADGPRDAVLRALRSDARQNVQAAKGVQYGRA
jgi:ATP-binding cassette subfamily C protein LapB